MMIIHMAFIRSPAIRSSALSLLKWAFPYLRPALWICSAMMLSACVMVKQADPIDETPPPPPTFAPPPTFGGSDTLVSSTTPPDYQSFMKNAKKGKAGGTEVAEQRYSVLRDAALAYGAQAGFHRRNYDIMKKLEAKSIDLSEVFNFNRVAFKAPRETGYGLPPVITHGAAAITVAEDGRKSVAADEYYRIEQPGRLIAVLPSWRDYLVLPLEKPHQVDNRLLPQDTSEKTIWSRYLDDGWRKGREQADDALKANMGRLRRDYLGMIEYRKAVKAGLITNLVLRSRERRATGRLNELYIGERRVHIENAARFVRNPGRWKPIKRRFHSTKK